MQTTREILSIVALAALGLCLLFGLAKMAMKGPKAKQGCDQACSLLVFVAIVLLGVSQLLGDKDGYTDKGDVQPLCGGSCSKGRCPNTTQEHSYFRRLPRLGQQKDEQIGCVWLNHLILAAINATQVTNFRVTERCQCQNV